MIFNNHLRLEGNHAFLGASRYSWINYDEDKIVESFKKRQTLIKGTELHNIAYLLIKNGIKLPKNKTSLNMYVNDAIGFKMQTEKILYYSDNCYGTADSISFRKQTLRIHDLKTGITPANIKQLIIYAAFFCLEYKINPINIAIELRIYQLGEILVHIPDPEEIINIMDKTIKFDKIIETIKIGGLDD